MSEIKIKPAITDIGKKRLSEGKFNITKATVVDDGINYKLIDTSFQDPLLQLKRTRLFDAWKDASSVMKYKIPMSERNLRNIDVNVNINFQELGDSIEINKQGKPNTVEFPRIINGDHKIIDYYATSQSEFNNQRDVRLEIPFRNNPGITKPQFLTFTLESCKYFDIVLSEENKTNFREEEDFTDVMLTLTDVESEDLGSAELMSSNDLVNNITGRYYIRNIYKQDKDMIAPNKMYNVSTIDEGVEKKRERYTFDQLKNELANANNMGFTLILNEVIDTTLYNPIEERNHIDSINFEKTRSEDISKTVNVFCTRYQTSYNSLILRYRGNYEYDSVDNIYSTNLLIFSETTGHFEKIKINLISAQPLE